MAKTSRIHLPGDITLSDASALGLVLAQHGALKSVGGSIDNETMTSIHDFAEFGQYETIVGEKITLEVEIEGPSVEFQAVLTGSDITVAGYVPHFAAVVGPAVAGVFPALTDIPMLANSEVIRKSSTADGKTITDRLVNIPAGVPAAGQYNCVDATGVITVDPAYVLYAVVNYAKYAAGAGVMLTTNPSAVLDPMDVIIMGRAWEPALNAAEKGGVVLKFDACEVIGKPVIWALSKEANVISVKFNVTSGIIHKSVYTA